MIEVEQEFLSDMDNGVYGDCLRACTASVFELPIAQVPHFAAMDDWFGSWLRWLEDRGFGIGIFQCPTGPQEKPRSYRDGYWIGSVKSPRIVNEDGEPGSHVVVMNGHEIVWDPHPARELGHLGFKQGYFFVALDPSRLVATERVESLILGLELILAGPGDPALSSDNAWCGGVAMSALDSFASTTTPEASPAPAPSSSPEKRLS